MRKDPSTNPSGTGSPTSQHKEKSFRSHQPIHNPPNYVSPVVYQPPSIYY